MWVILIHLHNICAHVQYTCSNIHCEVTHWVPWSQKLLVCDNNFLIYGGMVHSIHLSSGIGCAHTSSIHHYHENSGKYRGSCCCSPEEFVQFQDSWDHSERLDHFQHRMYCCWCRDMQLSGDKQRLLLITQVFGDGSISSNGFICTASIGSSQGFVTHILSPPLQSLQESRGAAWDCYNIHILSRSTITRELVCG